MNKPEDKSMKKSANISKIIKASILSSLLLLTMLSTQVLALDFEWAISTGGPNSDQGGAIITDSIGNVYAMGRFTGTVDFDPGTGVYNMTSGNGNSVTSYIQKSDKDGNFIWAKALDGTDLIVALSLALDRSGNICLTGLFRGTADLDPDAGVFNVTSVGSDDIFTLKLNNDGEFLWGHAMGSVGGDRGNDIITDTDGNIFVIGWYHYTIDLDPGLAESIFTAPGEQDLFVQKLDSDGNLIWVKTVQGTADIRGYAIDIDEDGNTYTTGYFNGTPDFDPGTGTTNLSSNGAQDIYILKLNDLGNLVWVKQIGGTDSEEASDLTLDDDGNILITGFFEGTVDFNPGFFVPFNLTSNGSKDAYVAKYSANGNFIWANSIGGSSFDYGNRIGTDKLANVFVVGTFYSDTVDLDPGADSIWVYPKGSIDIYIQKFNSDGELSWAKQIGGTGIDQPNNMTVDFNNNVYVTGFYHNTIDMNPGSEIFNLTSNGGYDAFILKLSQAPPDSTTDVITACDSYTWVNGTTYYSTTSTPTYTLVNSQGADSIVSLNLTINKSSSSTNVIHACTDYTWLDGITYDSNNYAAIYTTTNASGCDSVITLNLTIDNRRNVDIELAWAKSDGGTDYDTGEFIDIDNSGNIITAGAFNGTIDFDPSANVFNLTAEAGYSDVYIKKTDSDGNLIWAKSISSTTWIGVKDMTIDNNGNILLTGEVNDTADVDPSADTAQLISNGAQDVYVLKLDPDGNFLWASSNGGTASDGWSSISTDNNGNVYVAGTIYVSDTVDFDPGVGEAYLNDGGPFIQKFDADGNFIWIKGLSDGEPNVGSGVASMDLDSEGNVIVVGTYTGDVDFELGNNSIALSSVDGFQDIFIVKCSPEGNLIWAKSVGGSRNEGFYSHVTIDNEDNVIVTGDFEGVADLDPGPGVFEVVAGNMDDIFILKLNSAGDFIWGGEMNGPNGDIPYAIATDSSNNIYSVGRYWYSLDFDPGFSEFILTSTATNGYIQKLDPDGNFEWAKNIGENSAAVGNDLAFDSNDNLYITGVFSYTADLDPTEDSLIFTAIGSADAFIIKLSPVRTGNQIDPIVACNSYTWINGVTYTESNNTANFITSNSMGCDSLVQLNLTILKSDSSTYTISACDSYTWIDGVTYTESNNVAQYILTNSAGCDSVVTLDLTINTLEADITLNGFEISTDVIGGTYQWIDCNNNYDPISGANNQLFTASLNGSYAVEVMLNGCTDTTECVSIDTSCHYSISGEVYASSGLLETGTVYVLNETDETIVQTINVTDGEFVAEWLCLENYKLLAIAGGADTSLYDPTYYYDSYEFENSFPIYVFGHVSMIRIDLLEPTSVDDKSIESDNFIVYPNPTSGSFNIDLGKTQDEIRIIITDVLGRKIVESTYNQVQLVEINSELESGLYTITVVKNNSIATMKLIVE
ncbi:MAG: SBBP repeat-containing protein [Flavobacteriales bacterium]|nr:SBBP repeat-containing protein [Flavobacteriales bacterium]